MILFVLLKATVHLCSDKLGYRSSLRLQIHSMSGGKVLGSSLLFGIFLLLDCFVSSAISGLHLRAPKGVLNFYKISYDLREVHVNCKTAKT